MSEKMLFCHFCGHAYSRDELEEIDYEGERVFVCRVCSGDSEEKEEDELTEEAYDLTGDMM